jgi:cytochrome c556
MRGVAGLMCCVVAALSVSGGIMPAWASANASAEDVIEYRQNVMKTKDAQSTAIGQILAMMVSDKNLATHFEILLLATRQAKVAFEPKVVGGEALPAIWDNWADFSARLDKAEADIAAAIELVREHGVARAGEAAIAAADTCKGCHETYRKK